MSIVKAFASPLGVETSKVSHAVAQKYFEQVRRRIGCALIKNGQERLAAQAGDICVPRGQSWRPEVGLAASACVAGMAELGLLQLAVASADTGAFAQASIEHAQTLLADGWAVPIRGQVTVWAEEGALRIQSELGVANFQNEHGRLVADRSDAGRLWHVRAFSDGGPRYAIESAHNYAAGIFPWPRQWSVETDCDVAPAPAPVIESRDLLSAAMRLVSQASPHYLEWISCVVSGFLLASGSAHGGISSPDFPGLVAVSPLADELDYAEAILAEACHQYLFQLLLVLPLTSERVEEIHYVSAKRAYLTTRRALVIAHAHANTILMLRQLALRPEYAESARRRIARRMLLLEAESLPALQVSAELTDAGKELLGRVKELVAE
ncbi:aKG-HExxH-type peptide beta-hydroxylase [Pseudomonas sp. CGJS7]|uniref:aKG-HExxH-type peptide beta-hydroxylase n=1 Tax=Pseudomonas sp. CGJS7 TaxID=3109348 RepID=UPI00300B87EC